VIDVPNLVFTGLTGLLILWWSASVIAERSGRRLKLIPSVRNSFPASAATQTAVVRMKSGHR